MNKDFWKRPSFIASAVALFCFLVLDYMVVKVKGFGSGGGVTGFNIAKAFDGIDILLWLIPLLNVYMIWAAFNPTNPVAKAGNMNIAKIAFLIVAGFFWVRYMFLIGESAYGYGVKSSAGIGMWITLLAAVFIMFEGPIMKQVNQMSQKNAGGAPPPPPPSSPPSGGYGA